MNRFRFGIGFGWIVTGIVYAISSKMGIQLNEANFGLLALFGWAFVLWGIYSKGD
jgi:hypothetical protein